MSLFTPAPFVSSFSPFVGSTTFNPSDMTSGMALSNGNLTALSNGAGARGVRGVQGRNSGNYYMEFTFDTVSGSYNAVGMINSAGTLNVGTPSSQGFTFRTNGTLFLNDASTVVGGLGTATSGDVYMIAVDLTSRLVYFGKNGVWAGGTDPVTQTGGISYLAPGGTTLYPHYMTSGTTTNAQATANFGATPFIYPVPPAFQGGFG